MVVDAGVDKAGRDVDEQAEAGKATASLQPTDNIFGENNFFSSDAKHGFLGLEEYAGCVKRCCVAAIVGTFLNVDGGGAFFVETEFVAEGQVD